MYHASYLIIVFITKFSYKRRNYGWILKMVCSLIFIYSNATVATHDGVLFCESCDIDNFGHLGFIILLEYDNDSSILN